MAVSYNHIAASSPYLYGTSQSSAAALPYFSRKSERAFMRTGHWVRTIRKLIRNQDFWNIFTLYASLAINAAVNLIMIAYLARVLEPRVWGLVLLAQSFGIWLSLLPDFGFNLSAGRAVAQAKNEREIAQVCYSVTAGKLLLSLGIVPLCIGMYYAIEGFRTEPLFLLGGALFAVAQGFDPIWLFQGTERQYLYAIVTSVSRILGLGLTLLLVHAPQDGWIVMLIHALGASLVFLVGSIHMVRRYPPLRLKSSDVLRMLAMGWPVFQFRAAQSITGSGLLILGAVSPRAVEAFGSADRIMRNSVGLLGPISAAGMPRIARLIGTDASAARRTARLSFQVMVGLGLLGGALLLIFAPFVVSVLLGSDYDFVIPILRIVALALPLSAASGMLGIQWMLPLGLDRPLVRVTLVAGLLNVAGFTVLGAHYGAYGAAVTVVAMEALLVIGMLMAIRRAGRGGFWSDE